MNIEKYLSEFSKEIDRKGYRINSKKNYVSYVKQFLYSFNGKVAKPTEINEQMIKNYLAQFKEHNTQRAHHSAIKCFFKYAIKQPNKFKYIEYCKRSRKLPIVLSEQEVQAIFDACSNLKHKSILSLLYSCGLRVGEVVALKISDIDSKRMIVNIRDAKGGKDRIVPLHPDLLHLLRAYFKQFNPIDYLFNGQTKPQYTVKSIEQLVHTYAQKAGIKKRVYPHLFRHSSFTNMLEGGVDMSVIQKVAGHSSIKTTQLYSHISSALINKVYNPLSNIKL